MSIPRTWARGPFSSGWYNKPRLNVPIHSRLPGQGLKGGPLVLDSQSSWETEIDGVFHSGL